MNDQPERKREVAGLAARKAAARLLGRVIDDGVSLAGLTDGSSGAAGFLALDERDRALARAIATTALRHRRAIEAVLAHVMDRPAPKRARTLAHTLHAATAQILFMALPDSAAVNLAVTSIADNRATTRFRGFANAVLRRIAREKDRLISTIASGAPVLPDWMEKQLRADHGAAAQAIAAATALEPLLDITVRNDPQAWADRLDALVLPTGSLRVEAATAVTRLPGYDEGAWWVQDAAAALPARLLGDVAGKSVADLCAAPGGKTCQLIAAGARVTALDSSPVRLRRLQQNLTRLAMDAHLIEADVLQWQPDEQFDAVLLDAPCASSGTLRRHPDVMWTKTAQDVATMSELQARMLDRAIDWVRPGGMLVFSTCSLFKLEGEAVFAGAAADQRVAISPVEADEIGGLHEFLSNDGTVRTLPHHMAMEPKRLGGLDGFFAGRLQRTGS